MSNLLISGKKKCPQTGANLLVAGVGAGLDGPWTPSIIHYVDEVYPIMHNHAPLRSFLFLSSSDPQQPSAKVLSDAVTTLLSLALFQWTVDNYWPSQQQLKKLPEVYSIIHTDTVLCPEKLVTE